MPNVLSDLLSMDKQAAAGLLRGGMRILGGGANRAAGRVAGRGGRLQPPARPATAPGSAPSPRSVSSPGSTPTRSLPAAPPTPAPAAASSAAPAPGRLRSLYHTVSGTSPGASRFQQLKGVANTVFAPRIPGLERSVSAGPMAGGNWLRNRFATRPPVNRPFDRTRQALSLISANTGRGAMGLTAAGGLYGLYHNLPRDVNTQLGNLYGVDDPDNVGNVRASLPGYGVHLAAQGVGLAESTPLDDAHRDYIVSAAPTYLRHQIAPVDQGPLSRTARTMRWLNPAGIVTNLAMSHFGQEATPEDYEAIADEVRDRHLGSLLQSTASDNQDGATAQFYDEAIPDSWGSPEDAFARQQTLLGPNPLSSLYSQRKNQKKRPSPPGRRTPLLGLIP